MKPRLILVLVAVVIAFGSVAAGPSTASAEIEVRSATARNNFPDGLQFTIFMASNADIRDVRLRYRILPDGVNAVARPNCTSGSVVNCNVTVGSTRDSYMVPGAQVVYYWEISDEAGGSLITEPQTISYDDTRFEWLTLTEGNVTVYYYFGDEESHRAVLIATQETIDRFSRLLRTTIDFPIKVWVYRNAAELAPAVASRRNLGPNTSIRTLGEVSTSDTALVSRDSTFLDVVRHEVTHIVTNHATRNHIASIPTWINEGLSTYSQRNLLPSEEQALNLAIQRNRVLPITSLNASARGSSSDVSIFYAQSGSIIRFMVERYGDEKFGEFIQALANDTTDRAMQAVYGFDQLGLENEWRRAVGLPEVGVGGVPSGGTAPTQPAGQSGATAPDPTGAPIGEQGGAPNREDDSDSTVTIIIVVISVLAIAVLALGGFYLQTLRRPG
jgi:hypothetical protein